MDHVSRWIDGMGDGDGGAIGALSVMSLGGVRFPLEKGARGFERAGCAWFELVLKNW